MGKTYLLTNHGEITQWVARQPLSFEEEELRKMFPDIPEDCADVAAFLQKGHSSELKELFDWVASTVSSVSDSLETANDPRGKACEEWDEDIEVKEDDGKAYRYIFEPRTDIVDLIPQLIEEEAPNEIVAALVNRLPTSE